MRRIRILDKETAYASALADFLSRRIPNCEVLVGFDLPSGIEDAGSRIDTGTCDDAVVAGEGYLTWQPADARLPVLRLSPLPPYADDLNEENTHDLCRLPRLGDVRFIAETLERWLDSLPDPPVTTTHPDTRPVVVGMIGDTCDRVRKSHVIRMTAQAQKHKGRVVYLPCLPCSRAAFLPLSPRGQDTLTQLLLLAGAGDPCDGSIGPSLHPSRSGVLCIRPAESHEHLLECGPDVLRSVVSALAHWVETQPLGSIAVVDLAELPEHTTAAALSVCTECHFLIEQDAGELRASSRFAPLLARLPPGCRVKRVVLKPPCVQSILDSRPDLPAMNQEEETIK